MVTLEKRLLDLRTDHDKTQKEIGEVIGLSKSGYQKIEKGIRKLDSKELKELCEFYKVTADYILGLSEDPQKGWLEK